MSWFMTSVHDGHMSFETYCARKALVGDFDDNKKRKRKRRGEEEDYRWAAMPRLDYMN